MLSGVVSAHFGCKKLVDYLKHRKPTRAVAAAGLAVAAAVPARLPLVLRR
ncbi:MAG: hypothetical protein AAFP69_06825 [Planctomycetota bacterium]